MTRETCPIDLPSRPLLSGASGVALRAGAVALIGNVVAEKMTYSDGDLAVLNVAVGLEYEGINAFGIALKSGLLQSNAIKAATKGQEGHRRHNDALISTILKLGGEPVKKNHESEYAEAMNEISGRLAADEASHWSLLNFDLGRPLSQPWDLAADSSYPLSKPGLSNNEANMSRPIANFGVVVLAFALPAQADDANRGKQLYESCGIAYHSIDSHRVGPSHRGVLGRHADAAPGYDYSDAVRKAELVWTHATLDWWLANPEEFIPDQKMGYAVSDASDRADLIAYLKQQSDASPYHDKRPKQHVACNMPGHVFPNHHALTN